MSTCCEPRRCAGGGNDGAVEAEALSGLNAGGRAGNAEAQLVVGNERGFIHAGGGVEHAGCVGGVDLERGVVGGDERPRAGVRGNAPATATASAEPSSGSVAEPSSSSRTRECASARRERRSRLMMCAEKVESSASMDCASPMSARNAVKIGKLAAAAGTGKPGLGHHGQQRGGFEGDGLAAGVGAADDELAGFGGEFERERDNLTAGRARRCFSSSGWRAASRCSRSGVMAGATQS